MSEREHDGLRFEYQPQGMNGTIRIAVRFPDETVVTDKFDVLRSTGREKFLDRLCLRREGLDREELDSFLDSLANDVLVEISGADDPDGSDDPLGGSDAQLLVGLGNQAELFHTPGGHDSEGFASLVVNDHRETLAINSRAFKRWLTKGYYDHINSVPSQESLSEALNVLAGIAIHDGFEDEVAVRLAECRGKIYLDLADDDWRVVEISADGWRVIDSKESPVRFVRKRGMLPLQVPVRGGTVDELRRFVNVPGDDGWILYSACIVAYFRPRGPFPVLVLNGEHGSAKSTCAKCGRALVDPNQAPLRRPPKGDRDLMIAASNSWFVAFDNISRLTEALSDALCVIATGGGFSARQLYTDDEEKIFQTQRPVMLNGIEEVATRADLLDRSVMLGLPVIPDADRWPEDEFWPAYEEAQPRILGAFLGAVSCGLRRLPEVRLGYYPRMADFAKWAVACAPGMGWEAERFLAVYGSNRQESDWLAVESSVIGTPLMTLVNRSGEWIGTATALAAALTELVEEGVGKSKGWPNKGQKMRWALKRIAPNLRKIGYEVEFDLRAPGKSRDRLLRIRKVAEGSSEVSGSSDNGPGGPRRADTCGRSSKEAAGGSSADRPPGIGPGDPAKPDSDDPDNADDPPGTFRPREDSEWGEL